MVTGSKTPLYVARLRISPLAGRQCCVSTAPALQVRMPAGNQVKHSGNSTVLSPFLPLLPHRFWSFLTASCSLLLCPALLMSTETQSDSFLCLKIQMSKAVSAIDRSTCQKWVLVVKYSQRAQLRVRGNCSFFYFCFSPFLTSICIPGNSTHLFSTETHLALIIVMGYETLIMRCFISWVELT